MVNFEECYVVIVLFVYWYLFFVEYLLINYDVAQGYFS